MSNKLKYRPVLTAENITHILKLAKTESPLSDASTAVIAVLAPFQAKIDNAGIVPAYTTSTPNKQEKANDLLDSLGFPSIRPDPTVPKEVLWKQAYKKFKASPATCSLVEIGYAQEYMYLHDLMSPEEMVEFENKQLYSNTDN